jgi:hypothetical protein
MRAIVLSFLFAAVAGTGFAAEVHGVSDDLYNGWLKMYDLKFDEAHRVFAAWKANHAADALAPASDAAAWLFSELARLGALESEFFVDDDQYEKRAKLHPDPQMRTLFNNEIEHADRLADEALKTSATDANALFTKSLTYGLRANFAALVDREDLTALKFTKQGRPWADRLMTVDPENYDGHLGAGVENYLLSLKAAPMRFLLRLTGSHVDREKGMEELRITAEHGHYLEPFAKLLLAVAALRDNKPAGARELLSELHNRFPDNELYLHELNRLSAAPK